MQKRMVYATLIVIVVVVLAVLIYFNFSGPANPNAVDAYIGKPVPQSLISMLAVPNNVSNKIGAGTVAYFPKNINASPLTNNSKPEILYIGAEYCPYCAVTRWGMIIALMRFGQFSNLHYMASNLTDGDIATFTFYNSTYQSNYISFVPVETETRNEQPLQTPTQSEGYIFDKYNPGGGIPFIDFGNKSIQAGAPILPQILSGVLWNATASNLSDVNSGISQSIVGSADIFTAEICRATNFTPSSVCSQPYVTAILSAMQSSG